MITGKKLSDYLNISKNEFNELGIFDPFIGVDTHLFLDPALLRVTKIKEFKNSYEKLTIHFQDVLKLLVVSKTENDIFWKEALKRLIFKETRGISIGYGSNTSDGNAIGPKLAKKITKTASEIAKMGFNDTSIFELICLFEEGMGADRLSDMTISIIKKDIVTYTDRMVTELKLKQEQIYTFKSKNNISYKLIKDPFKKRALLLMPKELLKDLPLALTRDDIGYISYFNEELRRNVSKLLLGDVTKSLKDITKKEMREILIESHNMEEVIKSYKAKKPEKYDYENDPSGEVSWFEDGKEFAKRFPLEIKTKEPKNIKEVNEIVRRIISQFKRNIEQNELYELLYKEPISNLKPKNERYAQRLFYSVADTYCEANNIVLSREPNAGNGPVDFKVSENYKTQVLVEIKLSSGKVRNGFEKQLPEYEKNENAAYSFLVVIQVTKTAKQIEDVERMADLAIKENKHAPEVIIINGLPRESASKPFRKK